MKVEGKAELIGGRIVHYVVTGYLPSVIAGAILISLHEYARARGKGRAFGDNLGYAITEFSSGRESFSPDASYHDSPPPPTEMHFVPGPPTFAIEVRSKEDYRPGAERTMADKRRDDFEAGARVVWDVDPLAACVRKSSADDPDRPEIHQRGDTADAEPAVPGWRVPVDQIFKT